MLRSPRLLIAARALGGMTQAELAAAAKVSVSVLQAIEQGKSDPKLSTVLALLDALKAQGVQLIAEDDRVAWGVYVLPGSPADQMGRIKSAAEGQDVERSDDRDHVPTDGKPISPQDQSKPRKTAKRS